MAEKEKKSEEEAPIVFYCKDCGEIVKTERLGRRYVYKCKKCGTKNVAFGTPKSIHSFFRLGDDHAEEEAIREDKASFKKVGGENKGEIKSEVKDVTKSDKKDVTKGEEKDKKS